MNDSKEVSRSKKTNSKVKVLSQTKKHTKVLNDSLLESSKNLNIKVVKSEEKSISIPQKK